MPPPPFAAPSPSGAGVDAGAASAEGAAAISSSASTQPSARSVAERLPAGGPPASEALRRLSSGGSAGRPFAPPTFSSACSAAVATADFWAV